MLNKKNFKMENKKIHPKSEAVLGENRNEKGNIIIPDTNVFIDDPESIYEFIKAGNLVVIPLTVINELDNLKKSKIDKIEAGQSLAIINGLLEKESPLLKIEDAMNFSKLNLDKTKPDHQILATANHIALTSKNQKSFYYGYLKIKFITNDNGLQILARTLAKRHGISVEFYKKNRVKLTGKELKLRIVKIKEEEIKTSNPNNGYRYVDLGKRKIPENGAVLVSMKKDNKWEVCCIAVRKGNELKFLSSKIKLSGISPKGNGHQNFEQILAMHYLMDPEVRCVFLQGGAGVGKTLLALAAALERNDKEKFLQIIVSRPTISLEDEDMGWLPGEIGNKFAPWLNPIFQNFALIKKMTKPIIGVEGLSILDRDGITIQPLGFIRGSTFNNCFIIIDEAQNLNKIAVKTIITRVGEGSKVVFTGDLGQIDNPKITRQTSGLAHAIKNMHNLLDEEAIVGIVNFKEGVRSKLASLAERVL